MNHTGSKQHQVKIICSRRNIITHTTHGISTKKSHIRSVTELQRILKNPHFPEQEKVKNKNSEKPGKSTFLFRSSIKNNDL